MNTLTEKSPDLNDKKKQLLLLHPNLNEKYIN
jgi:hypothetical protein